MPTLSPSTEGSQTASLLSARMKPSKVTAGKRRLGSAGSNKRISPPAGKLAVKATRSETASGEETLTDVTMAPSAIRVQPSRGAKSPRNALGTSRWTPMRIGHSSLGAFPDANGGSAMERAMGEVP